MNTITNDTEIYNIYLKNYEYINKTFKRKNKHYYTLFDKKRVLFWICDGELMIGNVKNIKTADHSNVSGSIPFRHLEFEYKDGYLISHFFKNRGCNNYKFKCIE